MFDIERPKLDNFISRFRECTPRILVVTDGPLDEKDDPFGLSHFIEVLSATQIHGMTPDVVYRHRESNQVFNDLSINTFDVVFLFGFNPTSSPLSSDALTRIKRFMQSGGGLFATGDHEDLGTGMCGDIPRVRSMRYWAKSETPDGADSSRITTNLPGNDGVYVFEDQEDTHPQRLYPNYAVGTDSLLVLLPGNQSPARAVHPLIRFGGASTLHVYPDHPHEGECRIPEDLSTTFELDGEMEREWPGSGFVFNRPRPRAVAYSMSAGNGFTFSPDKSAVVPRSFIALAAYDGHHADVGRVVTDSTWHHYVNINLKGMRPGNISNSDMRAIEAFWSNMASWLMPKKTRLCLWPLLVVTTLLEHPILEEIKIPELSLERTGELITLGEQIVDAVDESPGSVASDLVADVMAQFGRNQSEPGIEEEEFDAKLATKVSCAIIGAHFTQLVAAMADDAKDFDEQDIHLIAASMGPKLVDAIFAEERAKVERYVKQLERTANLFAQPLGASEA
ncbi:hypothetical protein [Ferrimonas marina]|uniref:Uncharacterized protein n=1 Tax=Ferrimonas marina TaxID=299255 RepID=A0A1M5MRG0_9GAMM|nr:hypothetical protein [Ferrimonas marina]SHG79373.1 hypothetical protein SAMN02745129_0731 [Ferrimonas marina]